MRRFRWVLACVAAVLIAGIALSFLIPRTPHILDEARRVVEVPAPPKTALHDVYALFWADEKTLLVILETSSHKPRAFVHDIVTGKETPLVLPPSINLENGFFPRFALSPNGNWLLWADVKFQNHKAVSLLTGEIVQWATKPTRTGWPPTSDMTPLPPVWMPDNRHWLLPVLSTSLTSGFAAKHEIVMGDLDKPGVMRRFPWKIAMMSNIGGTAFPDDGFMMSDSVPNSFSHITPQNGIWKVKRTYKYVLPKGVRGGTLQTTSADGTRQFWECYPPESSLPWESWYAAAMKKLNPKWEPTQPILLYTSDRWGKNFRNPLRYDFDYSRPLIQVRASPSGRQISFVYDGAVWVRPTP